MEIATGVFVSDASEEWQPDDDPPGEVRFLCGDVGLDAGLWRSVPGVTPDPVRWTLPAREVILVLEGTARIEIEGGPTLELERATRPPFRAEPRRRGISGPASRSSGSSRSRRTESPNPAQHRK
jgi:uncharacterized cupin superfamily protein